MTRRCILAIASILALAGGQPAARVAAGEPPSGPPRPYIFTQAHQDHSPIWTVAKAADGSCRIEHRWQPQCVPPGARIQIQLPGNPTVWSVARVEPEAEIIRSVIPSPLRFNLPCAIAREATFECEAHCPSCCPPSPIARQDPKCAACKQECEACVRECEASRTALAKALGERPPVPPDGRQPGCPSDIYQFELRAPQRGEAMMRISLEGDPPSPLPLPLALTQKEGFRKFVLTLEVRSDCPHPQ